MDLQYQQSKADPCVFIKRAGGHLIVLGLYVHATMCCVDGGAMTTWLQDKKYLSSKYELSDLGPISTILNVVVTRDRSAGTITLSQQPYILSMAQRFLPGVGINNVKPVYLPMGPALVTAGPTATDVPLTPQQHQLYRSIVGALAYAAGLTRPDMSFAVGTLSRYLAAPLSCHLTAAYGWSDMLLLLNITTWSSVVTTCL